MTTRGFTLMELTLAAALLVVLGTLATSSLVYVTYGQRTLQVRHAAARQAEFLTSTIARDVERAGSGMPEHGVCDPAAIVRADDRQLELVGDFPAPGSLRHDVLSVVALSADRSAVVFARSGACVPSSTDACPCSAGNVSDPSCPWVGTWPTGVAVMNLMLSAPEGSAIVQVQMRSGAVAVPAHFVAVGDALAVVLTEPLRVGLLDGAVPGVSVAAHLDRVVYLLANPDGTPCDSGARSDGLARPMIVTLGAPPQSSAPSATTTCTLFRRQCWGLEALRPIPGHTRPPLSPLTAPVGCDVPLEGTPWEVIATGVSRMSMKPVDTPADVAPQHFEETLPFVVRTDVTLVRRVPGTDRLVTVDSSSASMPGGT